MSRLSQILPIFYYCLDIACIVFAFYASGYLFGQNHFGNFEHAALAIAICFWSAIGYVRRHYRSNLNNGFVPRMIAYSKVYLLFSISLVTITYFLFQFTLQASKSLLSFVLVFFLINIIANAIFINAISAWRRRPDNLKATLVVGVGDLATKVTQYFQSNPDFGFRVKGYLKSKNEVCKVDASMVVGVLKDIDQYLLNNIIDEIIIALPCSSRSKKIQKIVQQADLHGIRISYLPDYQGLFGKHFKIIHDGELEAVNVRQLPLDEFYPVLEKQIFDIAFSALVLLFLLPAFAVIAVIIKLDSRGPVLYCPMRVGRGGKIFRLFKFRTMYESDPVLGGIRSTQPGDARITRVGRFLRRYNLDELPQFFNVFIGDMSVVGPRPHRVFLNQRMREHYDKYMLRHYFKPGITGWAQVNGWRGPTDTEIQIVQRTAHDLWYIENWSFKLDIKIIWQTIFSRKAYQNAY